MAVPFSNTKLRVPKGFQNILEGLAREILRNQPENPFEFGSKYFDQLLKVREETGHDPAVHGARLEDRFYNNDSFKNPSVDPGSPQQQEAALKIQTNYRKHAAEQEVAEMKEEDAAEKIQAGFRGYQDRQKYQDMKSPEKKEEAKEEEEKVDIDLTDPDVEAAAVKIQAGFKGFKARQEIKDVKDQKGQSSSPEPAPPAPQQQQQQEEEVDIDLTDPEVQDAAQKIQAGFRGHKARKEVADMKSSKEAEQKTEEKVEEKAEEKEEVDIDLNDPDVENAALKIQAGFKGMKARQEIKALKESNTEGEAEKTEEKKEEEVDIDLNDPETEKAALKIQAGFKGYQTRKELKTQKEDETQPEAKTEAEPEKNEGEAEKVDIDLNDPETEKAALKIQASFKGYQTRKEMKEKKVESGIGTDETPREEQAPTEEKTEEESKTEG